MAGSGLQNIGVIPLMDAIVSYLPSPKAHEVEIVGEGNKTAKIRRTPKARWLPWYLKPAPTLCRTVNLFPCLLRSCHQ